MALSRNDNKTHNFLVFPFSKTMVFPFSVTEHKISNYFPNMENFTFSRFSRFPNCENPDIIWFMVEFASEKNFSVFMS